MTVTVGNYSDSCTLVGSLEHILGKVNAEIWTSFPGSLLKIEFTTAHFCFLYNLSPNLFKFNISVLTGLMLNLSLSSLVTYVL